MADSSANGQKNPEAMEPDTGSGSWSAEYQNLKKVIIIGKSRINNSSSSNDERAPLIDRESTNGHPIHKHPFWRPWKGLCCPGEEAPRLEHNYRSRDSSFTSNNRSDSVYQPRYSVVKYHPADEEANLIGERSTGRYQFGSFTFGVAIFLFLAMLVGVFAVFYLLLRRANH